MNTNVGKGNGRPQQELVDTMYGGKIAKPQSYQSNKPSDDRSDNVMFQTPQYHNFSTYIKRNTTDGNEHGITVSNDRFVICPTPIGRLGNIMFEFAAALGIARTLGYRFVVRPSYPLLKYFNIKEEVSNVEFTNVVNVGEGGGRKIVSQKQREAYLTSNVTLVGFFQAWDYFQNVSHTVRNAFTIKQVYLDSAKSFLKANTPEVKTLVGIHIRRGDFLSEKDIKRGKCVADKHYIKKAMDYFKKLYTDCVFVVASDDIPWCRENIVGDHVVFSGFKEPIIDLAILSLCDHVIISVGTFSWWAGWLSGGKVVYLKDFPLPGSKLDRNFNRDKYYCPDWIGFSNGPN